MPASSQHEQVEPLLLSTPARGVAGLSPKESRPPSNRGGRYLLEAGYRIIPVNPGPGRIFGIRCSTDIAAAPFKIDMVTVFRSPAHVPPIVEQAIDARVTGFWMQLGVSNAGAVQRARHAGPRLHHGRCITIEHARLVTNR